MKMAILSLVFLIPLIGCSDNHSYNHKQEHQTRVYRHVEGLGFRYEKEAPRTVIRGDTYHLHNKFERKER